MYYKMAFTYCYKTFIVMEIEGYIIEMLTIYANTQYYWDKFNRKVYKDLETAKEAWNNFPDCYKNVNGFINVKCRFLPVYRGDVELELNACRIN